MVVTILRGEVSMPNSTASLPSRGLVPLGLEALCGQLRPPELNGSGAAQSSDLGPKDKEEGLGRTQAPSVYLQSGVELMPGAARSSQPPELVLGSPLEAFTQKSLGLGDPSMLPLPCW